MQHYEFLMSLDFAIYVLLPPQKIERNGAEKQS